VAKSCDICKNREGALKVSQVDSDGRMTELWVCAECARQRGFTAVEELKADVADVIAELQSRVEDKDNALVCPDCRMTYAEFKRLGRVGCARCYEAFHDRLVPLVRRIHGAVQHVGRTTKSGRKRAQERLTLERLRTHLQQAIDGEDYERAAALRDQLRRAEDETDG